MSWMAAVFALWPIAQNDRAQWLKYPPFSFLPRLLPDRLSLPLILIDCLCAWAVWWPFSAGTTRAFGLLLTLQSFSFNSSRSFDRVRRQSTHSEKKKKRPDHVKGLFPSPLFLPLSKHTQTLRSYLFDFWIQLVLLFFPLTQLARHPVVASSIYWAAAAVVTTILCRAV